MKRLIQVLCATIVVAASSVANAGDVQIVDAKVSANAAGTFSFTVTLKHGDEGWKHYANAWDVVAPDGTVLGKRTLHHPHVDEQPFTRSLSGVKIPASVTTVKIRAYDSGHGISDKSFELALPGRKADAQPGTSVKPETVKKRKLVKKRRVIRKRVKAKRAVAKRKSVRRKVRKIRRGSY